MPETERFVSESITPLGEWLGAAAMASGEPGVPARFRWRTTEYEVTAVLEKWKTSSGCHSGGTERYVRRHWYRVATTSGVRMTITFDRQPSSRRARKRRWWLASVADVQVPD